MANDFFSFQQFTVRQDQCAMKVTTDACLFGAWAARHECGQRSEPHRVLDIGAGTGLLSLMYAQSNPGAHILGVEIDERAATQAAANAAASPFNDRVAVLHADVTAFNPERSFDLIISNPPFYEHEIPSASAEKNVAHHTGGLLLEELLAATRRLLSTDGRFYLLLPYKRLKEFRKLIAGDALRITGVLLVRQSVNHDFFRMLIRGSRPSQEKPMEEQEIAVTELSIWDEKRQYTGEFRDLLKGYYLQFV